jgi:hypothetical protein
MNANQRLHRIPHPQRVRNPVRRNDPARFAGRIVALHRIGPCVSLRLPPVPPGERHVGSR